MTHKHIYDDHNLCFECDKEKVEVNVSGMKLKEHIITHHNGNISAYAKTLGVRYDQVGRWLKRDCMVIDGKVYCEVSKQVKEGK